MVAKRRKGINKFPTEGSLSAKLFNINEVEIMNADRDPPGKEPPELVRTKSIKKKKNGKKKTGKKRTEKLSPAQRRRMFEVDGHPLDHWKKDNFKPTRDATCRTVYEPKEGKQFFQKALKIEDYDIMRGNKANLEQPYFSKYNRFFPKVGHFCCKACGNPLYSHDTKFDIDDGWPAFGACVLGAIGIIPAADRKAQIETEDKACIKIQAFVRGSQCRSRVTAMLDKLIEEMLRRRDGGSTTIVEKPIESDSDSESEDDDDESLEGKHTGYVLSRTLGENYAEIHCHRCKSHLGDVYVETNTGIHGETFREHHRVNGRAMKYMHANLPKRTDVYASLLFADHSQRRRLGLPDTFQKKLDEDRQVVSPFVRYESMMIRPRRPSESLNRSDHESTINKTNQLNRGPTDPLSVSSHASLNSYGKSKSLRPVRGKKAPSGLSVSMHSLGSPSIGTNHLLPPRGNRSCHEPMTTPPSRRRPMRRGGTNSRIDIEKRKAYLENTLNLKVSFH